MENYVNCNLVRILDRDQRTVKFCCYDMFIRRFKTFVINDPSHPPQRIERLNCHCDQRRNFHKYWKNSLLRLKHALLVGLYIQFLIFSNCLAAPTTSKSGTTSDMDQTPKWVNPCGFVTEGKQDANTEAKNISVGELLTQIIRQANTVLEPAKRFQDELAQKTFNIDGTQLHQNWKNQRYEWLPSYDQVPKDLGENVSDEHLKTLKLEDALLDCYEHLQKIGVGFEQIILEMERDHSPLLDSFKSSGDNLRSLLCELQIAILELNVTMRPYVERNIMPDEIRDVDHTTMNLRNWLIFRDYMNVVEYVISAFSHLKQSL